MLREGNELVNKVILGRLLMLMFLGLLVFLELLVLLGDFV